MLRGWLLRRPYFLLALVVFATIAYPLITRRYSEWDEVFVRAAKHLRAGDGIYHFGEGYVYPPFMALLATPFSYLSRHASLVVWYLINVAAILVLCHYAWRLATRNYQPGAQATGSTAIHHWIWLLGLACGIRYVFDGLSHQQTDIVIAAILMLGCWSLFRSRSWAAAICFGVAAGAKCTPFLFGAYLLWRKQWWQAAVLVVVAIGVNLLPNLVYPRATGELYLTQWVQDYLAPATSSERYLYSEQIYNQSLGGAINRWLTTSLSWSDGAVSVISIDQGIARWTRTSLTYGLGLTLLLLAIGLFQKRPAGTAAEVWEYSVVLILMVLLSPMSSKPHFCTLILPGFCLTRYALENRDRVASVLLVAAIIVGTLGIRGLVGKDLATFALWYGNVMWSALLLLFACGYMLFSEPRVAEPSVKLRYPLITPIGRIRATLRERPARSTTSTTSSTFL